MTAKTNDKPLYLGHRKRLKERFLIDSGVSMPDYEFLELLLTFAVPRRDVKDEAKKLLSHFGSLSNVFTASNTALKEYGLTLTTRVLFKVLLEAFRRLSASRLRENTNIIFTQIDYVIDYCKAKILETNVEEFHLLLLDKKLRLIEDKLIARGSVDEVPVYTREILKYVLDSHAVSVVLYHNHPSGDCSPSHADVTRTKEIVEALRPLGVKVYDHIIVSRDDYFSFHIKGLL